jgi:hypothetical protein
MNFQFRIGGTILEQNEAEALLSATKNGTVPTIIDLNPVLTHAEMDAAKLFELAVTQKNQDLASLAWKISVQQQQEAKTKESPKTPQLTLVSYEKQKNLDAIIHHLNNTTSYRSLGVAMLLKATKEKEWVTLREVATQFANEMWPNVSRNCKLLRGFEHRGGKLTPVDLSSGIERRHTFHVSPLYIALREGLLYCKSQDLMEQKKMLSVGAPYAKTADPRTESTRRIYYKIKATSRGEALTELWADIDRYIQKGFITQEAV